MLLLLLTVSWADDDHEVARRLRTSGSIVPMTQILQALNRDHPGAGSVRILEITLQEKQGHFIYNVECVDAHGVVWEEQYDAKRGVLLQTRRDK